MNYTDLYNLIDFSYTGEQLESNLTLKIGETAYPAKFVVPSKSVPYFEIDVSVAPCPDIDLLSGQEYSLQNIFDYVAYQLLKQGERAFDRRLGRCVMYDPETQLRCAAGYLLPIKVLNDLPVEVELEDGWEAWAKHFNVDPKYTPLIGDLQDIHDNCDAVAGGHITCAWFEAFNNLAQAHGLHTGYLEALRCLL